LCNSYRSWSVTVKFQISSIRDALFKLVEASDNPKIKSKVDCLTTCELNNFKFLLGLNIWYDIYLKLIQLVRIYNQKALVYAKKIAFEINIELKFL